MNAPTIQDFISEYARDAQKVMNQANEAARHWASGDKQAACDVIGLSGHPLGQADDDLANILRKMEDEGLRPGG